MSATYVRQSDGGKVTVTRHPGRVVTFGPGGAEGLYRSRCPRWLAWRIERRLKGSGYTRTRFVS